MKAFFINRYSLKEKLNIMFHLLGNSLCFELSPILDLKVDDWKKRWIFDEIS